MDTKFDKHFDNYLAPACTVYQLLEKKLVVGDL